MNKDSLTAAARAWLAKHQLPDDNAECYRLANFAAEQIAAAVKAERERIADELLKCLTVGPKGYRVLGKWLPPEPFPSACDTLFANVKNLIDELRQGK